MPIRFAHISQSRELAPNEHFDLAIGFVGPDPRSIRNLQDVFRQADLNWAIDAQGCSTEDTSTDPERRRLRANLSRLPESIAKPWSEQTQIELATLLKGEDSRSEEFRVFIDVSSFPRRMLASILDTVRAAAAAGQPVRLTLGYRLAQFSKPRDGEAPPNRRVAPVHRSTAGWPRLPGLPVHLIVGLGYERGKALGAVEYIQPANLSLFTPQSPEPKFAEQVNERNSGLLEGIAAEAVYVYQVLDPAAQFAQLSSMLASMLVDSKPVLLPFGPKIFFAVCVLLSFGFPEVSVWHVSGEEDEAAALVKPSEHVVYIGFSLASSTDSSTTDTTSPRFQ